MKCSKLVWDILHLLLISHLLSFFYLLYSLFSKKQLVLLIYDIYFFILPQFSREKVSFLFHMTLNRFILEFDFFPIFVQLHNCNLKTKVTIFLVPTIYFCNSIWQNFYLKEDFLNAFEIKDNEFYCKLPKTPFLNGIYVTHTS